MRIGTCPCAFCCPPQQSATDRNENTQRDPFRESSRSAGSTKDTNGQDHCEKIGSGITAMRAPTALRVEDASHAHPDKAAVQMALRTPTVSKRAATIPTGVLSSQSREARTLPSVMILLPPNNGWLPRLRRRAVPASAGIVSDLAVEQRGQVMMDTRIMGFLQHVADI